MSAEILFLTYRPLLFRLAHSYSAVLEHRADVALEDLVQAGFFGLVAAERTWRPVPGGKSFISWAAWYVRREMDAALGVHTRSSENGARVRTFPSIPLSLDAPLTGDADVTRADLLLDETLLDPNEVLFAEGLAACVREEVAALPEAERAIIQARYWAELPYAEIERLYGIPCIAARGLCQHALKRLRRRPRLLILRREMGWCREQVYRTGLRTFTRTRSSATELAALRLYPGGRLDRVER